MVQIINCPCGKTIAACVEPECYTDRDWLRELRKYLKKGYSVEMAINGEWAFGRCYCSKQKKVSVTTQLLLL